MKKIKVELTGITPLLMNSPRAMIEESVDKKLKQTTQKYDHEAEAEKLAYKDEKGELFVPSEAVKGCLIGAASYKKIGKYAAKGMIAGGVFILNPQIPLNQKDYELDIRTVVIQRARVVKARPMVRDWKINFEISYNENLIGDPDIIKTILQEAGQRVGLLDFRPQKMGSFGMFEVTKWQEK